MNDEDKRKLLDQQLEYHNNKLKNETVEEKKIRLAGRREKYANMDADKKKERQKKEAVAKKNRLAKETEEQKKARLEKR